MRAESAMQSDALSPAGARGLLQLMPATATLVARRNGLTYGSQADLMNPRVNIPLGIAHLAELQDRIQRGMDPCCSSPTTLVPGRRSLAGFPSTQ